MIVNKIDKTKRLSYLWEKNRLESFKIWPFNDKSPCNKQKLAEAGFFWTGTSKDPDSVQCFICEKNLDGWEAQDDPWEEHIKHSKNCLFAKLRKKEADMEYGQFNKIYIELLENMIKKDAENKIKILSKNYEKVEKVITDKLQILNKS